ncbi:type I-E CRISPR-associated protein Cas7/Cse4/CasC [Streptomyces albofaciens]|uniref:type I-E CRISPR-associated protein Cas7/Cse4/CasC n=1 Tax=Streptomyces albofaciens TaxID=66866 RepID=UPI00244DAB42|nr:type I-E CRISPR-associated protein Cas7/Cse4/CasC [Streptomyces albofaciens]
MVGAVAAVAVLVAAAPAAEPGRWVWALATVGQVLSNLRTWLMGILAGLATVFLTVGGVRYLLAGGDPGEVAKAKSAFRHAGLGYALAALAPIVVQVLKVSLPRAKRNSTAPYTLPDLAYLAVREHRPISLAAAFETPVTADGRGGFSPASRTALASYATQINRLTGQRRRRFHGHTTIAPDEQLAGIGDAHDSFDQLTQAAVDSALPAPGQPA